MGAVTARINHGHVGMFGNYLEREGHGAFVEWQRSSNPRSAVKQVVVPLRAVRYTLFWEDRIVTMWLFLGVSLAVARAGATHYKHVRPGGV